MKRKLTFGILPLIMSGGLLLTGCVSHHAEMGYATVTTTPETTTTRTVTVTQEPPAPRTEVEGAPPSEADVWVHGHWDFINNHWVWAPGHWETRPRANAVWVPGHWDKNPEGKGWVWTPGYWQ